MSSFNIFGNTFCIRNEPIIFRSRDHKLLMIKFINDLYHKYIEKILPKRVQEIKAMSQPPIG